MNSPLIYVPARARHASISARELEIILDVANGRENKEIAFNRDIANETVKRHLKNIYFKLGASNRANAVALAYEVGLLVPSR